ncbi:MAG TPA: serine hydrolase [Solirubrobacteraceae bacterium]|nr:serine hydrolase [Solirubrobacteraceae bacterium]
MSENAIGRRLQDRFARVGAQVRLHVTDLSGSREIAVGADEPVALASVVKILICLAFARRVAAGELDQREPVDVPVFLRVGGTGTTACLDPVRMSLRDLAVSMMSVSDNAATDVVLGRTGRDAVDAVIAELGLARTHLRGDMHWGHMRVVSALGLPGPRDLDAQLEAADPEPVRALAWLDPARSNASTPREVTRLLTAIWTDRAGPAEACRFVREAMAQPVSTQRLASAFDLPGARVAAKSGTLPTVRNEAGVITLPDGDRYAAAVFARTPSIAAAAPALDAAIGAAARAAVEHLHASR